MLPAGHTREITPNIILLPRERNDPCDMGAFMGIAKKPDSRKKLSIPYGPGSLFTEVFGEEEVEQSY